MAFCTSCGNRVADGAKFCTGCGTPIASASQPVASQQPVVPPQPVAAAPIASPAPELVSAPVAAVPVPTPVAPEPAPEPAPVVTPAPVAVAAAAAAPAMAPVAVAAAPQTAPVEAAPAQPAKKSNAMKIILIVLGVLLLIVVLIVGAVAVGGYFAYKKGKEVLQSQQTTGGEVNIKTPFGDINTTEDAGKIAAQMGVDVYPGATPLTEGTAASSFGGISVMSAAFETSDSIDQVEQFYKEKFPNSSVSASDDNKRAMIFGTPKGLVTLSLRSIDGKTKIDISRMEGDAKTDTGSSE